MLKHTVTQRKIAWRKFFPVARGLAYGILGAALLMLPAGCASKAEMIPPLPHDMPVDPPPGAEMLTANIYAGDALSAMLLQRVGSGSGILVTTMVNMEDLDTSSAFGRMAMQQISSRVAQHGFKVADVRLTNNMRMELRSGEFMLSRDSTRLLAQDHDAHAVLVGIYSRSGTRLFISTRVIRLADNAVIAAYEYYLPLSGDTRYLLGATNGGDGKSTDAVWKQYAARGQAFSGSGGHAASSGTPTAAPTAAYSSPTAQSPGKSKRGKAAVVPTSGTGVMTPFGEEVEDPGDGKHIDPSAKPTPIGTKQR